MLGKNDFPDIIPYYITEITISGTGATNITINIPEQGIREFNSDPALYIVQQDSPIVIEDIQFNTTPPVDPVILLNPVRSS